MFLRKIEINGFKSFANKTEFIVDSSITGVVGPNGSGKSNIADAIRWVLGEQSSKNLRGTKMEDVIFNGTLNRPKKAFCEVALVFDNEEGRIHSEYSEIVVSRKMYRSGESEYFLNGNSVRLKDILDIIRDTGIGKEGYSIVGQGRIDEILASKPTARRKVFEEAAGIMKFRIRKEEAERKLQKTDENLIRVEDILEELSGQLEPMQAQAEQTRRYLELFARQKVLDANLYVSNYDRAQRRIEKLQEEQQLLEEEIRREESAFGMSSEELEALNEKLEELSAAAAALGEQDREAATQLERLSGQQQLMEERIANLQREKQRIADETGAQQEQEKALREQLAADEDKKRELEEQGKAIALQLAKAMEERDLAEGANQKRQESLAQIKTQQMQLMSSIAQKTSEVSVLSVRLDNLADQKEGMERRLADAQEQSEAAKKELAKEKEQLDQLIAQKNEDATALNENNAALMQAKEREKEWENKIEQAKKQFNDHVSKKSLLEDLKAEYEGYSDSIRNLMKAAKKAPYIRKMLRGTVAENIHVPAKYEKAIETLLGGALQNVIVDNEYDAKEVIEFLRRGDLGRVTFLPLEALRINYLTEKEREALKLPGFLAVASEAMEYDEKVAPAVDFLLARTVIIDNMDNAIEIMRAADYSFRAVTLEGDIIRPGGTMSGGSTAQKQFGLLSRERNLKLLEEEIAKEKQAIAQMERSLEQAAARTDDIRDSGRQLLENLRQQEMQTAAQREKAASAERVWLQTDRAAQDIAQEIQNFGAGSEELQHQVEAARQELAALEVRRRELGKQAAMAENEGDERQEHMAQLNEQLSEIRVHQAENAKEIEAVDQDRLRIDGELQRLGSMVADKAEQISLIERQVIDTEEHREQLKEQIIEWQQKREDVLADMQNSEAAAKKQKEELSTKQKYSMEYQLRQTSLMDRKYKVESQLEKTQLSLDTAGNKMWEEYSMTYVDAQGLKEDISYADANREVQQIRGEIRDLGVVNPNAIEDYNRVKERVDELTTQQQDLTKAEEDLRKVIDELMGVMRMTFSEKFDQINENFQSIFKELFGGGRAELSFGEGDVMECGIDIVAEPPGKKLQHISLLSGGERALTAIALLFAMIRINPSPVCLLDEIDAPLDEANVIRFSTYLQQIRSTQFIVITHRKPTMTICDALYGVTMEEKGVSKLVSVKMDERR
ncbi:MAG: chromosome segregation protein SMC [Christensenellaceae bacterium]|nr:chromosome segregation protein SMC [Christensenellaceae bacterium]